MMYAARGLPPPDPKGYLSSLVFRQLLCHSVGLCSDEPVYHVQAPASIVGAVALRVRTKHKIGKIPRCEVESSEWFVGRGFKRQKDCLTNLNDHSTEIPGRALESHDEEFAVLREGLAG